MRKTQHINFLMKIEEVNHVEKKGIFIKGTIVSGMVRIGDHLEIKENSINIITRSIIAAIEKIENKSGSILLVSIAKTGDTVKLWLTNSQYDNIQVGQIVT